MKMTKSFNPVVRAVGVFSAVAIVAGGATYAALNSSATLTDNTIQSANANLLLWDGDSFESTAPGFTVTGLIPGQGSTDNKFYVKNAGDAALKVTAAVPTTPVEPAGGYGFTGWENLKVTFKSYAPGCVNNTLNTTMQALMAGEVELPCNNLALNAQGDTGNQATEGNYSVKFDVAPAAITGTSVNVGKFDIRFTGAVAAAPVVEQ